MAPKIFFFPSANQNVLIAIFECKKYYQHWKYLFMSFLLTVNGRRVAIAGTKGENESLYTSGHNLPFPNTYSIDEGILKTRWNFPSTEIIYSLIWGNFGFYGQLNIIKIGIFFKEKYTFSINSQPVKGLRHQKYFFCLGT